MGMCEAAFSSGLTGTLGIEKIISIVKRFLSHITIFGFYFVGNRVLYRRLFWLGEPEFFRRQN